MIAVVTFLVVLLILAGAFALVIHSGPTPAEYDPNDLFLKPLEKDHD